MNEREIYYWVKYLEVRCIRLVLFGFFLFCIHIFYIGLALAKNPLSLPATSYCFDYMYLNTILCAIRKHLFFFSQTAQDSNRFIMHPPYLCKLLCTIRHIPYLLPYTNVSSTPSSIDKVSFSPYTNKLSTMKHLLYLFFPRYVVER